jgi:predicted glycosyl hydrolase (DUF1957 family)
LLGFTKFTPNYELAVHHEIGHHPRLCHKRITDHLARFNYLHDSIRKNAIDERYPLALETMDNIFPEIDFRDFNP